MAELRLRQAVAADAEVVYGMMRDLAHHLELADEFSATLDDVVRDAFGPTPRYEVTLAEIGDRPAGLATYYPTYSTFKGRPALFLDNLFVEDWARGQQVGRALMAEVCRVALERGYCRIDLNVLRDAPARGFYETVGMEPSKEHPYQIYADAMRRVIEEG
jgi:GNAT superfamily N-acetyltransferase